MAIAAVAACVVINFAGPPEREARRELIGHVSLFLAPMVLMPFLVVWFLASMPPDSRSWVLGGSVTLTMFMGIGVGASLLIGAYAIGAFWYSTLSINGFTAALLCAIAFAATAWGEFVREGVREPYSIRNVLYSNSMRQDELERLRVTGSAAADPYALHDGLTYPNGQLEKGAKVYRFQCSVCHTYDGANGLLDLTDTWTFDQKRLNIAQMQRSKAFMPPFAGTAHELEALVQLLSWRRAGMPHDWPASDDPAALAKIQVWLDEVGTRPGIELLGQGGASAAGGWATPERDGVAKGAALMNTLFPFGFPWPTAMYLTLFVVTTAIYMVFMNYVLAGSIVLLIGYLAPGARRRVEGGPARSGLGLILKVVRDWLPAVLGLAITTGIAPLLFLQILYKHQFYTANLLLFRPFMLLVPAFIVAYFMLYLIKGHALAGRWAVCAGR